MGCPGCGRGFHNECENSGCSVCHPIVDDAVNSFKRSLGVGAPLKEVKDIRDPYSTGRKRAATQYPIHATNPCEWRGKKNCGGGKHPIIGCVKGLQQDRHHGPIKNPLRNEPGNVHRICKFCHNRWHELNDPVYNDLEYEALPHSPELADEITLHANEVQWNLRKNQYK